MDAIDVEGLEAKVETVRAEVIAELRRLADRLEQCPEPTLCEVLPIVAASVDELGRRVGLWLR